MLLAIEMLLAAESVRRLAPVHVTASLTKMLPPLPVAPPLLLIVTLVVLSWLPSVAPVISPPVPTV